MSVSSVLKNKLIFKLTLFGSICKIFILPWPWSNMISRELKLKQWISWWKLRRQWWMLTTYSKAMGSLSIRNSTSYILHCLTVKIGSQTFSPRPRSFYHLDSSKSINMTWRSETITPLLITKKFYLIQSKCLTVYWRHFISCCASPPQHVSR